MQEGAVGILFCFCHPSHDGVAAVDTPGDGEVQRESHGSVSRQSVATVEQRVDDRCCAGRVLQQAVAQHVGDFGGGDLAAPLQRFIEG